MSTATQSSSPPTFALFAIGNIDRDFLSELTAADDVERACRALTRAKDRLMAFTDAPLPSWYDQQFEDTVQRMRVANNSASAQKSRNICPAPTRRPSSRSSAPAVQASAAQAESPSVMRPPTNGTIDEEVNSGFATPARVTLEYLHRPPLQSVDQFADKARTRIFGASAQPLAIVPNGSRTYSPRAATASTSPLRPQY